MNFIHTRLRDKKDDDIQAWYDAQADKSEAVREAIRVKMRLEAEGSTQETVKSAVTSAAGTELPKLTEAVTSAADTELARLTEAVTLVTDVELVRLREAVVTAAGEQLARLPDVVAAAVRDALASYRLAPSEAAREPGQEDPELAARLDDQLEAFFADDLPNEGSD